MPTTLVITAMPEPAAIEHAQGEARVNEPVHRPWLSLGCVVGVFAMLIVGFLALPREGAQLPAVARQALEIALPQWKITEPVNEIVYGTRGFDTFGETFLLLAAIVSVSTLARHRERRTEFMGEEQAGQQEQQDSDPDRSERSGSTSGGGRHSGGEGDGGDGVGAGRGSGEHHGEGDGGVAESAGEQQARRAEAEEAGVDTRRGDGARSRRDGRQRLPGSTREPLAADTTPLGSQAPERSEAMTVVVRVAARIGAIVLAVTAIYLFARGFTPGGGFPAGAAISGVALLLYAALGYRSVSAVVRPGVLEPIEMVGALIVVGIAVAGFFIRGAVMANWLPLAPQQTIASGGLLQAFSSTEFLEVGTGLTIAIFAMLAMKHDWTPDESDDEEGEDASSGQEGSP